jgi:N-methylhydantoinase A
MSYMIGVDVGGTFTDLSVFDPASKSIFHYKLSSTPGDPSRAIVDGILQVLEIKRIRPDEIGYLAHGTTVATNALIEKKGSRVGLITTRGFKDMMEIGWQRRPHLYDLLRPKPQSIIPPGLKCAVNERVLYDGSVKTPLDEAETRRVVRYLKDQKVEAIAVCTLFSFINPEHEARIKAIIRENFPEAYVSVSHELVHEFREFARMSTTVLNAYLGPVMKQYIYNFEHSIKNIGIKVAPYVTQSNGSIISISETIDCPIKTAVSGPSAGVVGAAYMGNLCGLKNIITFDMGGTSADISLIDDGKPQLSAQRLVEGYPARIPMIDIVTIGAGGGSIACIDEGGALKVGPASAGAKPGPACYGRGGTEPTVTDANIVLGKLNQTEILGGRMAVRLDLAREALRAKICNRSTLTLEEAATGIIAVVNSNMIRAIRVVSVERGYDVRDFALMAFGGAGPLHACEVAAELGISKVFIPPSPGTLCSLGLLMADTKFDLSRSHIMVACKENLTDINDIFVAMLQEGSALLDKEKIPAGRRSFTRSVDARYLRQNYEITIPLPDREIDEAILVQAIKNFHIAHEKSFGYYNEQLKVQFVNYRLSAIGDIEKPEIKAERIRPKAAVPKRIAARDVLFVGEKDYLATPVYHRDGFKPGCKAEGPMIIEQMDTTTVVPPGWTVYTDGFYNLHVIRNGGEQDGSKK